MGLYFYGFAWNKRLHGRWVNAEIDETTGDPKYNEIVDGGITRVIIIYNNHIL